MQAAAELSVLAACALWLQRLREGLAALWHLTGTRVLAQDTQLLQEVTQLLWNNAETPVRTRCQRALMWQPGAALPSPGSAAVPSP